MTFREHIVDDLNGGNAQTSDSTVSRDLAEALQRSGTPSLLNSDPLASSVPAGSAPPSAGLPTIKLAYGSQTYIVPLTTDVSAFFIYDANGLPTQVQVDVAAKLFGAEKAVLLLNSLHNNAHVDDMYSAWQSVIDTDKHILELKGVSNLLSSVEGTLIAGALGNEAGVVEGVLDSFISAAKGALPGFADLALTARLVSDASDMLATADAQYFGQIAFNSNPINIDLIKNTLNDTMLALNVGNTASNAAQNIPGIDGNFWDDLGDVLTGLFGPLLDLTAKTGSVWNNVATQLQRDLAEVEKTFGTHLEGITAQTAQNNFFFYLTSILYQAIATANFGPLTTTGLEQAAELLRNSAYVLGNNPSGAFLIAPPQDPINESSGTVTFTITRADASHAASVYVSTVTDQGTGNPNGDTYYTGLLNKLVTFAANQKTATVSLTIHDLHLYLGSESFRIMVQQNPSDPITAYLASEIFTINNTDAKVPGNFSISPGSPIVYENQGVEYFTITRSDASHQSTVYVSTVHDQGSDNPGGNFYYHGLLNYALTFNPGVSSLVVPLTINDLGSNFGSESFRLIVQDDPTEPTNVYLATDTFTIVNNDSARSYSLSPATPVVPENGPPITFTITRSGPTSAAETVYVSTLANQGYDNTGEHWYHDLVDYAVTFQAGFSSATFTIAIHDNGLTSGSERFAVIIQKSPSDPLDQHVASATFTIQNTDTGEQSLGGNLTGAVVVNGEATVSGIATLINGARLENNGTITVLPGGLIGSDSNSSNTINNNAGGTFSIQTATTVNAEIINNAGVMTASPGAGNTAMIGGVVFFDNGIVFKGYLTNTGLIEVTSGTLNIYDGGASSASGFVVSSGARLLFTGPDSNPFVITGGTYSVAGSTQVGDASHTGALVFGAGTTVNLGIPWTINGTVDMSAATLTGSFAGLEIGTMSSGLLKLGSSDVGISNLDMAEASIQGTDTITLTGVSAATGNFVGAGTVVNQGLLTVSNGSLSLVGGKLLKNIATLSIDGGAISSGDGNSGNKLDNVAGATLNVLNGSNLGPAELDNEGQIYVSSASGLFVRFFTDFYNTGALDVLSGSLLLGGGGTSNASDFHVAPGATLSFGGNYTFTGGTYEVQGDTVVGGTLKFASSTVVNSSITNAGTMEIVSGTLTLEQGVAYAGQVAMDAGTTLALGMPADFSNSISGFVNGNVIDMLAMTVAFAQIDAGEHLVLSDGATTLATLNLGGVVPAPGTPLFVGSDGAGGSDIIALGASDSLSNGTVCFADGSSVSIFAGGISGAGTVVSGSNDTAFVNHGIVSIADNVTAAVEGVANAVELGTNVTILLGSGDDTIAFTTALVAADKIDAGAGNDTVVLDADYSAGVKFAATTVVDVEKLSFGAGHSYVLTTNDANLAAGQLLTVDGSSLGAGDFLTFNGAAEADGSFVMSGGAGADTLVGGHGNDLMSGNGGSDTLNLSSSGDDVANGGDGNDSINAGAALTAADRVDGGAGSDLLFLNGDYSAGLTLAAATMINVERLAVAAGHSYAIATDDANVAAGQTLSVNGSALGANDALTFDGSAETDGSFAMNGGAGADRLIGGGGNDAINGNAGDDSLDLTHGGIDAASGGDGDDTIDFGNALTAAARIDGGAGADTVTLDGDYGGAGAPVNGQSAGLVFSATTMINVETLFLAAGHDYQLVIDDATVSSGQTLAVDGSGLVTGDTLFFDGSADADGTLLVAGGGGTDTLIGGAGNDTIAGGGGDDTIDLTAGGNDTVAAGDGNDAIEAGAALSAADRIDGGAGFDTIILDGDYSSGLALAATTLTNVEAIVLAAGHSYILTTNDATVANGQALMIDGSGLGEADTLAFDGSGETDGMLVVRGGAGADTLVGGAGDDDIAGNAGNDALDLSRGGDDAVVGGDGDDAIAFDGSLTAADRIDGGSGNDTVFLDGDYAAGVRFSATTMTNVETLVLGAGHSYSLATDDAIVAAGQTLTVDGAALGAGDALTFDGSVETDGAFAIAGGAGADVLAGGGGNDVVTGNGGDDALNLTAGGVDTVDAGDGNDRIDFGATLTAADRIDGGTGYDTVSLNGDYSAGLTFGSTTLANVEALSLVQGHVYRLTTDDANVGAGQLLLVDGGALGSADSLVFNGSFEKDGSFKMIGGAGHDVLTGGAGNDVFDLSHAGKDTAKGGDGDDLFVLGAALDASDKLDGGAGNDTVLLNGGYGSPLVFGAHTMIGVETLALSIGHNYHLVTRNGIVAAGQSLTVDGSALGAKDKLNFDGSGEHDGRFDIIAGAGNDVLTGGAGNDVFDLSHGGKDKVNGGTGDDTFLLGAGLGSNDKIDGGAGLDTVVLDGDYSAGFAFGSATMLNVETLRLTAGHSYLLTMRNGTIAAGQTLTVDASSLGAADRLAFDGSGERDGHFVVQFGLGKDSATGGATSDVFVFGSAATSTSVSYDTLHTLNFSSDRLDLSVSVAGIDAALHGGNLDSGAEFDADLRHALKNHLDPHFAILFTASTGSLAGQTFLVVDENGVAGYQAGQDLVICVTGNTGTLTMSDFI